MATFTLKVEVEKDIELMKKWETVLNYSDKNTQPVPEHQREQVSVLLEKVELAMNKHIIEESAWTSVLGNNTDRRRIYRTLIPFIRRNYTHFINEINLTIEHYPIELGCGELAKVVRDYECKIIGNHVYDYDIVGLWKINGKYYLDG
jgi:hypothetical protein